MPRVVGSPDETHVSVSWQLVAVIARVLADQGFELPEVNDDEVLLIKRHDVAVGCSPGDAGMPDAGMSDSGVIDAATDAGADADAGVDAGVGDAGVGDAGVGDAGTGCTMIPGDAVTMVVQPHFTTATMPSRFAMLYVTPSRPVVEVTYDPFSPLRSLTAPEHVVEEVEVPDPAYGRECRGYEGCGGGNDDGCSSYDPSPTWTPPGYGGSDHTDGGVVVEMVGPYQVLRVHPTDRDELTRWLDQVGFEYDGADVDALAAYIARDYHVVAVRVAPTVPDASLQGLAITWAGSNLAIPAALNAVSSTLTVYISADGTYAFPGAQIRFSDTTGSTYVTRNELHLTRSTSPDQDPIAVRQPQDLHFHEVIRETVEVHVPVQVDCDEPAHEDRGCCSDCNTHRRVRLDMIVLALAVMFVIRRRRPS
jgi:hypothetical protein